MGDYYNVTRGPLSMTLNDGTAASVTPKKWYYISPANEGSSSVQKLVAKGFLVRSKVDITVVASPEVSAAISAAIAPAPVADAVATSSEASTPSATSKVDRNNKSR